MPSIMQKHKRKTKTMITIQPEEDVAAALLAARSLRKLIDAGATREEIHAWHAQRMPWAALAARGLPRAHALRDLSHCLPPVAAARLEELLTQWERGW